MSLLALDLGTQTGWARWLDGRVVSGVAEFRPGRHEGAGMQFVKFRGWLVQQQTAAPIAMVAYEEVRRHLGTDAAHAYGGFWAILTAWCQEAKVPFVGVPVGTLKRWTTGKGNADKTAMAQAVKRRWSIVPVDDNEADAVALLQYARETFAA